MVCGVRVQYRSEVAISLYQGVEIHFNLTLDGYRSILHTHHRGWNPTLMARRYL